MTAHLNVVTIGVTDFARSVRFYSDLGFERRMKATGDEIAFFDAGGLILSHGHAWEAVRAPGFEFTADGRVALPD